MMHAHVQMYQPSLGELLQHDRLREGSHYVQEFILGESRSRTGVVARLAQGKDTLRNTFAQPAGA
jgi:hypothetical protein